VTYILDEEAREQEEPSNEGHSVVIRDKGHSSEVIRDGHSVVVGCELADFLELEDAARIAGLEAKHIAALRIYTSPLCYHIRASLRNPQTRSPCPVTILLLDEALKLLRQVHAGDAQVQGEYWRGMKDLDITEEFKRGGGTEHGFMSTSTNNLSSQRMPSLIPR
jgi:hypothetical protein